MISLATLIKKVSALTGRVTKVAGKMDSLTRLFEGLDESFRNHVELWESSSRDRIVGAIKQHNAIEELGKTSESLVICNGDLNERMDKLQGEVGGLENIRGSLNSRVTNVEGELDELRGGEGGGGGSEMYLRDRIETLEKGLNRIETIQYEDNESRVSGISEAGSRVDESDVLCRDRNGYHISKLAEHGLRLEVVERQLSLLDQPTAPSIMVGGVLSRLTTVELRIEEALKLQTHQERASILTKAGKDIKWIRLALGEDA